MRYSWSNRLRNLDRDATAAVWCESCGLGWDEMPEDAVRFHRGCGFEGYYGPEPDESWTVCPNCNARDLIEAPRWLYRSRARRRFALHSHPKAA